MNPLIKGASHVHFQPWFALMLCGFVFGCYQPSQSNGNKDPRSINTNSDSVKKEITEALAIEFALELEESIASMDAIRTDQLVNMEFISELAFREVEYPDQVKQIFLEAASKQSMFASLIEQVRNFGDYRFLKLKQVGNAYDPIFRLVSHNGGISYHEFKLTLNSSGRPIAADFYTTALGTWTQGEIVGNMMPQLHVRDGSIEISDLGKLFQAHSSTFSKMLRAVNTGEELEEALEEFRKLPEKLYEDRRFLTMATAIASRISQEELKVEVERFSRTISDESILDPFLVDLLSRQEKTDEALEVIQRMDDRIGGDIFLDFLRANAFLASGRLEEAFDFAERVRIALPNIYAIYRTCIVVAARRNDFQQVTRLLREIESKFDQAIDIVSIMLDEELADYVESSEFQKFKESVELEATK
jgi:tetratricopeptide (TPR) repeat protein